MGYRKQLSFRTDCLNIMYPNFKNKTRAKSLTQIEVIYQKSAHYRIDKAKSIAEKRAIVTETNPLFYVFGETRKVFKPYLSYEENFNGT